MIGRSRRTTLAVAGIMSVAVVGVVIAWLAGGSGTRNRSQTEVKEVTPAYNAYLRGRMRLSSESRADNDAAIRTLREAIAADPSLAPAYATLARAYAIKAFYFAPDSEKKRLSEDAEVAVEKALSLDPNLGEAYLARGLLLWTPAGGFPHEEAVRAYKQALALDATLDEAHHQLAVVYFHVGLLDKAEAEVQKALAINPGNTLARFRLGEIELYRGEFERAHAIFTSTPLDRSPALRGVEEAMALFRMGREKEATALIDKFLREYPRDEGGVGYSVRAMMLAKAGRRREAEAAIARSRELGGTFGHFHHAAYNIATAYALLGDRDQAIRWLEDAAANGFPCYLLFESDTQLDNLRSDPRFVTLIGRLRRDWLARRETL